MKFLQPLFIGALLFVFSCSEEPKTDVETTVTAQVSTPPASEDLTKTTTDIKQAEKEGKIHKKDSASNVKEKEVKEEIKPIKQVSTEKEAKKKKSRSDRKKRKEKEAKKAKGKPVIEFKETEFNFGHISQGDKIMHDFVFENTGKGDLEILNVDVTCGCTTPTYPFIPIAPGEKGTIGVSYNSTGKLGNQKPMITIITNAKPRTYKIYLKGVVDAERAKEKTEAADSKENH